MKKLTVSPATYEMLKQLGEERINSNPNLKRRYESFPREESKKCNCKNEKPKSYGRIIMCENCQRLISNW